MSRKVLVRHELLNASIQLGRSRISLDHYATTGVRVVAIGPPGGGKTNAGLCFAEQFAEQGWVSILIDPEGELESMYGRAMRSPQELARKLQTRDQPILVVNIRDAESFLPYGEVILEAADTIRKPLLLVMDEGQMFSHSRSRKNHIGETSDQVNRFFEVGRKRALDLFITAQGFSGTLHRSVFRTKNITLVGAQQDPTAWSALAPMFRETRIGFSELMSLAPGQFYCFSRTGVEKVTLQLSKALALVAPKARAVRKALPTTFSEWTAALAELPEARLRALDPEVTGLLGSVVGLSGRQMASGLSALQDELATR